MSPLCLPATRPSQSRSPHKLLLLQPLDPQDTAQPPSTHTVLFTLTSTKTTPTICWEKKTSVFQRLTSSAVSQWCSTSSRKSSRDFSPVQRWSSFLSASCSRVGMNTLRAQCVSSACQSAVSEDTHCLTDSEDTRCLWGHTLSHCLWGHTLTLRTHTDSLTLRTHTDSLTLRTHCLWGHSLWWKPVTSLLNTNTRTYFQEADWEHLVFWWQDESGDIEMFWWVRDQLNQPDVDLNFPDPSL